MSKKPSRTNHIKTQPGARASLAAADPMDPSLLERIVKLMAANDLNTVDVRDGQRRVILKRGPAVGPVTYAAPAPQAMLPQMTPSLTSGGELQATPVPETEAGTVTIVSPMVGTFYSKPSPDAKPFVTVGSKVDEETVVCIVEAMKHYNPVKAEVRGTIARILVSDGEVVDVNKPMFLVKP
jgi:acetyl-CoA carboxylase biotin carboxyl carrier protein